MAEFEPRIIAFLCNWCAYTGIDLAANSRMQYSPNVRIIRVMCIGSVDATYIIKALIDGADGVLVAGCHLGDCHYQRGNYAALGNVDIINTILRQVGFDEDRVWLRCISASEGQLLAQTIDEMGEHLKAKGPSSLKEIWAV